MTIQQRYNTSRQSDAALQSSQSSTGPLQQSFDWTERQIQNNPLSVTLAAFGVGLGVGALIGVALSDSAGRRRENIAMSIGRRVLDNLSEVVPESLQQRLGG